MIWSLPRTVVALASIKGSLRSDVGQISPFASTNRILPTDPENARRWATGFQRTASSGIDAEKIRKACLITGDPNVYYRHFKAKLMKNGLMRRLCETDVGIIKGDPE